MAETQDPAAAAADEKAAAAERHRELAESQTKLAAAVDQTVQAVAGLAERVAQPAAQPQAAQPQQPIRVTEEQVDAAIERGDITRAQGFAILARQNREDAKAEARRETQAQLAELGTQAQAQQVASLIESYKEHVPGLSRRGSEEWNEAASRFRQLVNEGYPRTLATELQALRELYGRDPSKAAERESAPVRERTKERATRGQETTSSSSARSPTPRRRAGEPDPDLSTDHRNYVERMIQIGQYKSWDDPRAVKYVERAKAIAAGKGARRRA